MKFHVMASGAHTCWDELFVRNHDQSMHNSVAHHHTGLQASLLQGLPGQVFKQVRDAV